MSPSWLALESCLGRSHYALMILFSKESVYPEKNESSPEESLQGMG